MKKEKWKTFVTDRWKVAAPGLLAAFAVCFIFFIYAPLELYVTNQTEFWFDFYKILKAVLQNFALFFGLNVLGILLAACISKVFAGSLRQRNWWFCLLYMCRAIFWWIICRLSTARKSYGRTTGEKI